MLNIGHVVVNDRSLSQTSMEGNVLRFNIGLVAPLSPFDVGKSATGLRAVMILPIFLPRPLRVPVCCHVKA